MGEKVRPLPNREISSGDNVWENRLNIFIVSEVLCLFLDLLRPPLHPRLCTFFFGVVFVMGPLQKRKRQGCRERGYFTTTKIA